MKLGMIVKEKEQKSETGDDSERKRAENKETG